MGVVEVTNWRQLVKAGLSVGSREMAQHPGGDVESRQAYCCPGGRDGFGLPLGPPCGASCTADVIKSSLQQWHL